MASNLDINQITGGTMTSTVGNVTVPQKQVDGVSLTEQETKWENKNWQKYWGYFNLTSDLNAAILMKGIWDVGKGYTTNDITQVQLDRITGWGKDTFEDILFNMDVVRYIGGDSFAEIIRNDNKTLINLKPLDPEYIVIVIGKNGRIIKYEQKSKVKGKKPKRFKVNEIFHLCNNRLANQVHGISKIEAMESTILADQESFEDMKKIMHFQARPYILWKLKTDDSTTINKVKTTIEEAKKKGEDNFIPDDNDIISHDVIEVNVSSIVMAWRDDIRNKFYRGMGLPLIIFGSGGSTEAGGKIEYFAHEQVFENEQRYLEKQIWSQLGIHINLIPPQSMKQNLQADESKDKSASGLPQGIEIQPADTTAGVGK